MSEQELLDEASGHMAVGDLEESLVYLKKCTEYFPDSFEGWHALGMTYLKLKQYKEAIGAGLMATTLRPNDLLAWTALSQMYVANHQIAEAEDAKGKARILSLGGKIVKEV
jgi:Flp pilus assembly protein TadD